MVGTAAGRKEKGDAEAPRQRHLSPTPLSAGSRQEGVQLQGGNPKEIHMELINIRPTGDKCQTIGQQGASCLRDPS